MFQQIVYAQYANPRSFYGNIQLGAAPKLYKVYGAWPEEVPPQQDMLIADWQEPAVENHTPVQAVYADEIASRIAIIKRLKSQIESANDLKLKNVIREQVRIEREAKERAFKLQARIDEEESTFILLN